MTERFECNTCHGVIPHDVVQIREFRDRKIGAHKRTTVAECPHCGARSSATYRQLNGVWELVKADSIPSGDRSIS